MFTNLYAFSNFRLHYTSDRKVSLWSVPLYLSAIITNFALFRYFLSILRNESMISSIMLTPVTIFIFFCITSIGWISRAYHSYFRKRDVTFFHCRSFSVGIQGSTTELSSCKNDISIHLIYLRRLHRNILKYKKQGDCNLLRCLDFRCDVFT